MIIRVTERHIQKGVRTNPCECPVAKAIKDATGLEAIVSPAYVTLTVGGSRNVHYTFPHEVKQWIRDYDAWSGLPTGPMSLLEPFAFKLKRYS